jgi:putative membrane protein
MEYASHGWGMGLGWLIPLLIIGLLFYLVQNNQKGRSSAQDILDRRYANGEIDEAEYKKKSQDLQE